METFVVRVWVPDRPGALGQVASRIGAVRGDVVGIDILERGAGRAVARRVVEHEHLRLEVEHRLLARDRVQAAQQQLAQAEMMMGAAEGMQQAIGQMDALLAAYKKTPGATRHAQVKLDGDGEFRVYGIEIPEDVEERLIEEARERAIDELERIEEETGERQHTLVTDEDLTIDLTDVPEEVIQREDGTLDFVGHTSGIAGPLQAKLQEMLPYLTSVFIPPGWDEEYTRCYGFSLEDIFAWGMRSVEMAKFCRERASTPGTAWM